MRLITFLFASIFVGVTFASAQVNGATHLVPVTETGLVSPGGLVPFSLVRVCTAVQTLGNGIQITSRTETHEWQDALGRKRMETSVEQDGEMKLQSVSIWDPVLRRNIFLHSSARVAEVRGFPQPPVPAPATANDPRPVDVEFAKAMQPEYQTRPSSHIEYKNERLEPTVIAGERAEGYRSTSIIPAGEIGNDAEIRSVSENWTSPRLGISLRSTTDDPRRGRVVDEVTELHLEVPDPSMFQPPPGYQVFDLTRDPAKP
jgi:hypothetical protein